MEDGGSTGENFKDTRTSNFDIPVGGNFKVAY